MSGLRSEKNDQRRVWIIDDSPFEAEMARKALAQGFETRVFTDGSSVLEQLVAPPLPDVLVLDWVMPGISGIDVCKFLRSNEATAELSILLLTAQNQTQQIVEGLAAGANDYLSKPYSPAELVARVGSLVRAKRMSERAENAEQSMRALLAHLPDALITIGSNGEVTFLNAEAKRVLPGHEKALGRQLGELFPALSKLHEARVEGENFEVLPELEVGELLFAPAVRRMTIEGVSTLALTLRDVTERRRLELRRLDFYSMVAHDLRSPLNGMMLRVEMMRQERHGPLAERYRTDLALVDVRIRELVELINDFLDIARSESVGLTLTRTPVDLVELVRSNLADFEELALANGVTIHLEEPTGPVQTVADRARLKQVITNLISNAVKFSPKGGQVKVQLERQGPEVEFAVSDAGRGIAADKISELFQRYSRPAVDAALPGTGLGLMIVREIVAAHSGTCGVKSKLGEGSRFWFKLPAAP